MNEQDILNILQRRKLRLTKQRKAFTRILSQTNIPMSVAEILERMLQEKVAVNKTTVYREIERFLLLGIIQEVRLGDRKQYFEKVSHHHHHLICLKCEHIEDVNMDEQALENTEKTIIQEKKFKVLRHSLEFFGLCRHCQIG